MCALLRSVRAMMQQRQSGTPANSPTLLGSRVLMSSAELIRKRQTGVPVRPQRVRVLMKRAVPNARRRLVYATRVTPIAARKMRVHALQRYRRDHPLHAAAWPGGMSSPMITQAVT
jgi:hypothetical protein